MSFWGSIISPRSNLKSSYHKVQIEHTYVWKTAFKSRKGLFKWLVMPFGLKNSLATFMRLVDDILWTFTKLFVVVYLDDILVFNKSWEEHLQHKLCENLEKWTFGMSQVQYLGYIIDECGVNVDPTKIQVIQYGPALTTLTELHNFLGLANFYRRFMLRFSHITWPLN